MKYKIALIAIFGIICAAGGAYGWHKTHDLQPMERIVIKEVEKPVYKYVKYVDDYDFVELRKARDSQIEISYVLKGSNMKVTATDKYKETTVNWKVFQKPDYTTEIIIGVLAVAAGGFATYKVMKR